MQLDFLFSRLGALNERIEDTEDLIEADLDHRRVLRYLVIMHRRCLTSLISPTVGDTMHSGALRAGVLCCVRP